MQVRWVAILVLAGAGCASYQESLAQAEGDMIMGEGIANVTEFREHLVEPEPGVSKREPREPPVEVPKILSLDQALGIATEQSRRYKTRREGFFLTALGLGLTRRNFKKMVWSGSVTWDLSDGRSVDIAQSTALAVTGTRSVLPTGGRFSVTGRTGLDIEPDQQADASTTLTFSQPLLRGRGRAIAWEPLKQAERSLIYEARDFELFRQDFAIGIINQYYVLVRQKRSVDNARQEMEGQGYALSQAEALYRLEIGKQGDVLRAQQNYTDAQNSLLDREQAYQRALDAFKIDLGLPLWVEFDIVDEIPEPKQIDVTLRGAVEAALVNRLDLTTDRQRVEDSARDVNVAHNALLPDLDFSASYTAAAAGETFSDLDFASDAWSFGVFLEIPLDRKPERNAYKTSLINYDRARRGLEESEDTVVLTVRDALRTLDRTNQQIENNRKNVKTIERRLLKADLENRAGLASNRDVVEATQELTDAKNSLNESYVDYLIARLRLLREMGLLFIDRDGKVIE